MYVILLGRPVSSSWVQPTQGHGRRAGEIPQMSQRVVLQSSKTSYTGHSSITQLKMEIKFITYKTMTSFPSSFVCILFSTEKKVRQLCVFFLVTTWGHQTSSFQWQRMETRINAIWGRWEKMTSLITLGNSRYKGTSQTPWTQIVSLDVYLSLLASSPTSLPTFLRSLPSGGFLHCLPQCVASPR